MRLTRNQVLAEMGIRPIWRLRQETVAEAGNGHIEPASLMTMPEVHTAETNEQAITVVPGTGTSTEDWSQLEQDVANCRACPLCENRRQAVLGVGDRHPDWLLIGEGPGAEEDVRGEPFVGQAGKLLDSMLAALDLRRGNKVYIANAVKCRPPGNRTPEAGEMAACRPFLERQIALLQPRLIVLLGKAAVHTILGSDSALGQLRGKVFSYQGIPVAVTYHPAYLLRNLPDKAKAWEDLLFARRLLNSPRDTALPL